MNEYGTKSSDSNLIHIGFKNLSNVYWNASSEELIQKTIAQKQGILSDTGALVVDTGEFTGRSPKDRFIVFDDITKEKVNWGDINIKFDSDKFDKLYLKVLDYFENKDIYIKDAYVCADENFKVQIRVFTEFPWQSIFAENMFLRYKKEEILNLSNPEWNIISAPGFFADIEVDGTRQKNFAIINFTKKVILIGGTAYTGEIKKGVFSVLNFILPTVKNVLPMHCSANQGEGGDTALFFGLSGTGKTTLSADPYRHLIGDDEHGWSSSTIFNFEGGCYAKCVNLSKEKEPDIWNAIKHGSLLENVKFFPNTTTVDFVNISKTENTRVSYPIDFINNRLLPSVGSIPKNIFFLTCDALGILPPVSKLDINQAMYYFISGYTAKVAGTEMGIKDPELAFSACFGRVFLPLHPFTYAKMLGDKLINDKEINVWLVNTGWSGGPYGTGKRISLSNTRQIIHSILDGSMKDVSYKKMPIFNLYIPTSCNSVSSEILDPRETWQDKDMYDRKAKELALAFISNFEKFKDISDEEILSASPKI